MLKHAKRNIVAFTFLPLLFTIVLITLHTKHVSAGIIPAPTYPDPADVSNNQNILYNVVGLGEFPFQETNAILYADTQSGITVDVIHAGFCNAIDGTGYELDLPKRSSGITGAPFETVYEIFNYDLNTRTEGALLSTFNVDTTATNDCANVDRQFSPFTITSPRDAGTNKFTALVRARITNQHYVSAAEENSFLFKTSGANSQLGSIADGRVYNVANRRGGISNYDTFFAPPCNYTYKGTADEKFFVYDDDYKIYQSKGSYPDLNYTIYEGPKGTVPNNAVLSGIATGGNFSFGPPLTGVFSITYTWKANMGYRIQWTGLSNINALAYRLPLTFDQYNTYIPCSKPVKGAQTEVTCTAVTGWAIDDDRPNASLGIQVYINGPEGTGTLAAQGTSNINLPAINTTYGVTGNHGYSYNLSGYADLAVHSVYVYALDIDTNGAQTGTKTLLSGSPKTIGPCALPRCGNTTTDPADPEVGQPFTMTVSFIYDRGASGLVISQATGYVMDLTVGPYHNANQPYSAPSPPTNTGSATTTSITINVAGPVNVVMRITGPGGSFNFTCGTGVRSKTCVGNICSTCNPPDPGCPPSCTNPLDCPTKQPCVPTPDCPCGTATTVCEYLPPPIVVYKPYLKVYGNDVAVGGGFRAAGVCSSGGSGDIRTFMNGSPYYQGASVQYGAFLLGIIAGDKQGKGFYSGSQTHPGGGPDGGNYTTFANVAFGGGGMGGRFVSSRCITDFYDAAGTTTRDNPISRFGSVINVCDPSFQTDKQYTYGNAVTLTSCVGFNKRVTLYVNGSVTITGNQQYAPYNATTPLSVPYLTIISNNNIDVANSVHNLDGLYVSQGGTINTCTQTTGLPFTAAQLYDTCRSQLTINGAFITSHAIFSRTNGSLRLAPSVEPHTSANIAEVFVEGPEMFIGSPVLRPVNGGVTGHYGRFDSITSLSPLF